MGGAEAAISPKITSGSIEATSEWRRQEFGVNGEERSCYFRPAIPPRPDPECGLRHTGQIFLLRREKQRAARAPRSEKIRPTSKPHPARCTRHPLPHCVAAEAEQARRRLVG